MNHPKSIHSHAKVPKGLGFELYHKLSQTDRGRGGLILEASTLGGQITNSATSDITDDRKSVIEIGIRIDW